MLSTDKLFFNVAVAENVMILRYKSKSICMVFMLVFIPELFRSVCKNIKCSLWKCRHICFSYISCNMLIWFDVEISISAVTYISFVLNSPTLFYLGNILHIFSFINRSMFTSLSMVHTKALICKEYSCKRGEKLRQYSYFGEVIGWSCYQAKTPD